MSFKIILLIQWIPQKGWIVLWQQQMHMYSTAIHFNYDSNIFTTVNYTLLYGGLQCLKNTQNYIATVALIQSVMCHLFAIICEIY